MTIRWLDRRRTRTAPITEGERTGTEPGPITAWLDAPAIYDHTGHTSHTSDSSSDSGGGDGGGGGD